MWASSNRLRILRIKIPDGERGPVSFLLGPLFNERLGNVSKFYIVVHRFKRRRVCFHIAFVEIVEGKTTLKKDESGTLCLSFLEFAVPLFL